jgi:ribonuclease T2
MLFVSSIFANMIFSASYQKDFCKVNFQKECRFSKNWDYFTIHGLWPKKQNCAGIKHFRLSRDLWNELKIYMPSNYLKKHEWMKHGRCYTYNPEIYFKDMVILIKQVNNSPIKEYFNKHRFITKQALNRVINLYCPRSARKVQMICKKGYITELRFSINGDIENENLCELMRNAKDLKGGCQEGKVER